MAKLSNPDFRSDDLQLGRGNLRDHCHLTEFPRVFINTTMELKLMQKDDSDKIIIFHPTKIVIKPQLNIIS